MSRDYRGRSQRASRSFWTEPNLNTKLIYWANEMTKLTGKKVHPSGVIRCFARRGLWKPDGTPLTDRAIRERLLKEIPQDRLIEKAWKDKRKRDLELEQIRASLPHEEQVTELDAIIKRYRELTGKDPINGNATKQMSLADYL